MRKTRRLADGTVIEPRDAMGCRGYNSHSAGWTIILPNGRKYQSKWTLAEILRDLRGR